MSATTKRGKILRDTSTGDGLVFVEGKQHPFRLEGHWKSDQAPKVNMVVDVEFGPEDQLASLRSVATQDLVDEHAAQALGVAQDSAKKLASEFQRRGLPVLAEYAKRIGYTTLGALTLVIIGWFFLPALSVRIGSAGGYSITFYQVLSLLNAGGLQGAMALATGGGSAGILGFLCFATLFAVLLPHVWSNKRAVWGVASPLVFMLLVLLVAYFKVSSGVSSMQHSSAMVGNREMQEAMKQMADQAAAQMREAVSIGIGTWLSLAAAIVLAVLSLKKIRGISE